MRLLFHEKILAVLTLTFLTLAFTFALIYEPSVNVVTANGHSATPYLIDINSADIKELDTLDGIGAKTAEAIIEYRKKHGAFKNKNELCEVSGIGSSTLEKIKNYIKV